jgi:hypothetical protein
MAIIPISPLYYPLLASGTRTLDIKVKSPWPGQINRREQFRAFMEPEHVLVRKAREGVKCRLICLDAADYQAFFRKVGHPMAESPAFDEVQNMIAEFLKERGEIRKLTEAANPEISFVIADETTALAFLGSWGDGGGFEETVLHTEEPDVVKFLTEAFDVCWRTL